MKRYLDLDVLTAARQRIAATFDNFARVYLSFSAGKDSTVMLHLVAEEAQKRNRQFGLLFIDLEAQYKLTVEFAQSQYDFYKDLIEPYWVSLPLHLRNAVSQYEPHWICWDPSRRIDWVRNPPDYAISDPAYFPFFRHAMEFEEFTPAFGHWYAQDQLTACFIGIRSDESLNRYRTIASDTKTTFNDWQWTTQVNNNSHLFNVYPLYDWRTEDIWSYFGKFNKPYNQLYDRMHQAGLSIHQARICQPYGDDQRRGLWLYQIIEPETWGKVVARVNGANQGALYAGESGNILGNLKIRKPDHLTWQEFAQLLLETMPQHTREHYKNKIAVFLKWYQDRGYPDGIPDEGSPTDKIQPSWTRICKALLRNDYWCKGLSFNQTKTDAYDRYQSLMKRRREEWNLI